MILENLKSEHAFMLINSRWREIKCFKSSPSLKKGGLRGIFFTITVLKSPLTPLFQRGVLISRQRLNSVLNNKSNDVRRDGQNKRCKNK